MYPTPKREAGHGVHQISASLNYLGVMSERPSFHVHDHVNDNLRLASHITTITNARSMDLSLDVEGFRLIKHRTSVVNLASKRAVLCTYRAEMERLVGEISGATQVIAAPLGVLRVAEHATASAPVHRPVRFVHADWTDDSATKSLSERFFDGAANRLSERRCAIYHVWRVLTPAPQDAPLALCDGRTVTAQDCVAADTIMDFPGSRAGRNEASLFRYNAGHRWYYFPDMTQDEVLVFKDFDSDPHQPCRVPHTAFVDPTCPSGVPARVSLDLQLFAMF